MSWPEYCHKFSLFLCTDEHYDKNIRPGGHVKVLVSPMLREVFKVFYYDFDCLEIFKIP